ncbi:hypothetical protein HII31_06585 [Pseudocercospora fuligena]|uniref:Heterokaryon incompatibility domain-containing protein n=1 Tax=Pseudocercospora fuligena TaxID=685502 RepID=A0A8H6RJK4_9PEZI|nr:hypothetical protein HII31_06585 [Pseudocercospora fuligena]
MPIPGTTALHINGELVRIPGKVALILSCLLRRGITTAWVDAICINQTDQVEKGEQVSIIGAIYVAAEEVVIVLGKPTANTDRVFTPSDLSLSSFPMFDRGIIEILSHKYWLRAWILQEVGLANKIRLVCGNAEYRPPDFDALAIALHKGRKNNFESYAGEKALESISTTYDRALESPLKILGRTSRAQCSDPRDALYSKRELLQDPELIGYPDYSISANELFIRFAMNNVKTGRLDILHHTLGKRDKRLPSWVPDWTPGRHHTDKQAGFNADRLFYLDSDATEDESSPRGLIHVDQQELIVTGIILKQICEPHDPGSCHMRGTNEPKNDMMACTSWGVEKMMTDTYLCQIDYCELPIVLRFQGEYWKVVTADDQDDVELWLAHERHHFDGGWDWPIAKTVFRIR